MDYKSINNAIINSEDVPNFLAKDGEFYNYLLNNSVAYYYCAYLSKNKSAMDQKIVTAGNILNSKFIKTLRSIYLICEEKKIKFLLFKTYKYIPEAVDNDIDLFIKEKDFHKFIDALKEQGFECLENEHLKGLCKRAGFCNIEPRVNSSFHELIILDEKKIWEKTETVKLGDIKVSKATKEIDLFHLLLSVIYNPNYLKLYQLLLYKSVDLKELLQLTENKIIAKDLKFLVRELLSDGVESKHFPLFMGNINFVIWWLKRILPSNKLTLSARIKNIVFFFYAKYLYLIFNKLVFKHDWFL